MLKISETKATHILVYLSFTQVHTLKHTMSLTLSCTQSLWHLRGRTKLHLTHMYVLLHFWLLILSWKILESGKRGSLCRVHTDKKERVKSIFKLIPRVWGQNAWWNEVKWTVNKWKKNIRLSWKAEDNV